MTGKRCSLIVDGSNLLCRAAFALPKLTLADDAGTPCGGAWGLLSSVVTAVEKTGADEIHICWDGGRSPRRKELLPTYKGNRGTGDAPGEDRMAAVWAQAPIAEQVITACGGWSYRAPDVEADDIIALLALSVEARGRDAVIVSNDADFLQLVSPEHSSIMVYTDKDERLWQWGKVKTALVGTAALTTKVLMGCGSDNIPGIKGVGEARAVALRESVLVDGEPWEPRTLEQIATGEYTPAGYGHREHRNVTKAVELLRSSVANSTQIISRNLKLVNLLHSALDWPEVGEAALRPTYCDLCREGLDSYEAALEITLDELGWKPARFLPLLGVGT